MNQTFFDPLLLWQFNIFSSQTEVAHYVSGKGGGVSENGTLNLSYKTIDEPGNVEKNRSLVAASLGLSPNKLLFPEQTHSVNIKLVSTTTRPEDMLDTDALISNVPGICISVLSADCVPVLLYDPVKKAVGALHAGWRGTVGKLLEKTIQAMIDNFKTNPSDIIVGIGPSISPQVYEVGEEVIAAARKAFATTDGILISSEKPDKAFFNLWEANKRQALAMGVLPAHIEVAELCTYTNSDQFFSARKVKNQPGRFAAGIVIKEPVEQN